MIHLKSKIMHPGQRQIFFHLCGTLCGKNLGECFVNDLGHIVYQIDRRCFTSFPSIEKRAENMMHSIPFAETKQKEKQK